MTRKDLPLGSAYPKTPICPIHHRNMSHWQKQDPNNSLLELRTMKTIITIKFKKQTEKEKRAGEQSQHIPFIQFLGGWKW